MDSNFIEKSSNQQTLSISIRSAVIDQCSCDAVVCCYACIRGCFSKIQATHCFTTDLCVYTSLSIKQRAEVRDNAIFNARSSSIYINIRRMRMQYVPGSNTSLVTRLGRGRSTPRAVSSRGGSVAAAESTEGVRVAV